MLTKSSRAADPPAANRGTGAVPGGGTRHPLARCGTEEKESTTSILVQGRCSQDAETAVAELKREEQAVTLTSCGGTSQPRRGGQSEIEKSRTNESERGRCSQDAGTRPGVRRDDQGVAVELLGGRRQEPLGYNAEDEESGGDGLDQGCLPEAKARAGITLEAPAVALKSRAGRQPCTLFPTGAKQKEALRPAQDKPRNGEKRTPVEEKVLEEPTACLAHTAAGGQNPFPLPNLTSADSPECSGSKHVHQQPHSQSTGCPQSSAVAAESVLQKGGEADVTPADRSAEFPLVQLCTISRSSSNRAREGGPGNRTCAVQPTLPCKVPPLPPANGRTLAKGTWSACKPFPKKETVIKAKHGTTAFSSGAFGIGAVRTVVDQKCAQLQVMSGTQNHLEGPPVRSSVRISSCNAGAEGGSEQHEPTSAKFLAVAPLRESCESFLARSTEKHGEQVGHQGPPALSSAVVEDRQSVGPPNPAAATTLTTNKTSSSTRQTPTFQSTARPGAARQGRACQVGRSCKLTNPLGGRKPSYCIQRYGTRSPSKCKAGGASRREQTQESKGVKATAACGIATRADAAENERLPQAQHHCRQVSSSLKAARPGGCGPARRHAGPPWMGPAIVCKSAPLLPLQAGELEGSKSPGGGDDLTGDTEAHTNATEDGLPAVAVPLLGTVNRTEPQSETESGSESEVYPVFTARKQDEQLDSADEGPASPSVRRYPFVPLLPLHLLPGILARKDAEEAAFERAYGISYQEYEDIMWQLSLDNRDHQSEDTRTQERTHSFGDNSSCLSPTSETERNSAADQAHHAASVSSHLVSPAQVSARNGIVARDEEMPKAPADACSSRNATESVVKLTSNNTIYYLLPEETDVSLPALVQDGCNNEVTGATAETAFPPLACAQLRPVDLSYYLSDDDEETQQELPKAFCLVPATLPHATDTAQYCEGSVGELAQLAKADTDFPGKSPFQAPNAAFQRIKVLRGNQAETAESFRNETLALEPSTPKPVSVNSGSLKERCGAQQERAKWDTGSRPRCTDLPSDSRRSQPASSSARDRHTRSFESGPSGTHAE
ncbi:unnamed protein product [Rangifer tarandus platyrhynchus]|uniref:Uncharacterized protein n=1 Tax=Rangifer tarandus platyrhynchus TaxID=3082113 RepID=A0ABN8XJI0_RANTA|nr:unnamed protein product [Rangifer tarandus platyrhynchus]